MAVMNRPRFLLASAGVVLAALVVGLAVLAVPRAPDRASPAPQATGSPAESTAGAPANLGAIAWVFAPPPAAGVAVKAYELQAGTLGVDRPLLDLQVAWHADLDVELGREPAVGPPTLGSVIYVADDGTASRVHRAGIAADGRNEILAELDAVVWDLAVAPDGTAAYAAIVARENTERDLGVVRVLLDGSGAVDPVMPPAQVAQPVEFRWVAIMRFDVDLAVSDDGRYLVRRVCAGVRGCSVEVRELATGLTHDLDGEVVGVAGGAVVMRRCTDIRCGMEATALETGATLFLEGELVGKVVSHRGDPLLVLPGTDDTGRATITAVALASGERMPLYRAPEGGHLALDLHLHLALSIPEGYLHVTESIPIGEDGAILRVRLRELLVSLDDGRVVEVPRPAFRPPPGWDQQG
jgi:hypothetical protein